MFYGVPLQKNKETIMTMTTFSEITATTGAFQTTGSCVVYRTAQIFDNIYFYNFRL